MDSALPVLIYLRPTKLIMVREIGPYETTIPTAWDKLFAWLRDNGLYDSIGRGFGLAHDNPQTAGADSCRYDACVECRPAYEGLATRDLSLTTLDGGVYARNRLAGSYDSMRSAVANVYGGFHSWQGLRHDASRPVVSIYFDNPNTYGDGDLRADLCVPVVVDDAIEKQSFAVSA